MHKLGKLYNVKILVDLSPNDTIQEINLKELPIEVKDKILEKSKEMKKNKLDNWFSKNDEFILDKEEYNRLVNLNDSILKTRSISNELFIEYLLQSLNLKKLKEFCKEKKLKGYSSLKKNQLVEFITQSLSKEERFEFLEEKESDIIFNEFTQALQIIHNKHKEKIVEIKVNKNTNEIELSFSAFNWTVSSYICITEKNIFNPERDCDCTIGSNNGFCPHFFIGLIKSFKLGYFTKSNWKLFALPFQFEKLIKEIRLQ